MSFEYWYLFPISIGVATVLKTIFAVGLIFIGLQLFLSWRQERKEALDELIEVEAQSGFRSELTDRAGNTYRYTVCNKVLISWLFTGVGLFMLSTLLGV